ncbi:aspartyl protease family protein [Mucilaginibacter sp. UR6-11]|uniref:aspartyl protease family protein n=1 Tax=Mucilaginibacter sp. UR6-11 TaxID=1435644 RepID=UPI001E2E2D0C|nr:aspartyl protease family protein [Mucilaginibacter sp. UR6-11]MCC8425025.1 aspartyl protease family protein [Mucilaginibacter sp. UR6-11]
MTGISCFICLTATAQSFSLKNSGSTETIPFELVRNLIVIKLKINNQGPYNFVLDTGVGYMLITEPSLVDSIKIESKHTVTIHGFGEGGDFEAYITNPLKIDINGVTGNNVSAAIFKKDNLGLSAYAGKTIHGLIGYEFFSRLAVKINFSDSTLTVSDPLDMRYYKRGAKIPITIEDRKPYLNTKVTFANGTEKQSKLIIDLGAGHFISIENLENKNTLQKKAISANLGVGINGLISGTLSRIKQVELGKYKVNDVIAAFPDNDKNPKAIARDGNLGIGLLRKFDVIFDYPDNLLYLKPGAEYKKHDEHDMSGLTYYVFRDDFVHVIVDKIEPGSAGSEAGLQKNDEIVMINLNPAAEMSLQQIDDLFKSRNGRSFFLLIYRDKKYLPMHLTLKRRI